MSDGSRRAGVERRHAGVIARQRHAERAERADVRGAASTARCCTPAPTSRPTRLRRQAGAGHRRRQLRLRHRRRRGAPRGVGRHLACGAATTSCRSTSSASPSDTLNQGKPLPPRIKQAIDTRVLKVFTGDPVRFGFPKPDYKIYESHPIVNSLVLHHLGHGDISVPPDIDRLDGERGALRGRQPRRLRPDRAGHRLHAALPVHRPRAARLGGHGARSSTSTSSRRRDPNLFVLGMIEASGIGWQGRYEQAELVARVSAGARARRRTAAHALERAGRTARGPTCPAATTTSGSSGCPTTSTRTPTAAPCGARSSAWRLRP